MDGGFSFPLCGVGGQGIVLMSKVIGTACAATGSNAVTGEQHGLSQRSGSISIHFRIGPGVTSPLIPLATAEAIVSLEALECLRVIEYLKPGGTVFTSTLVMNPVTSTALRVRDAAARCWTFGDVQERLAGAGIGLKALDARVMARKMGFPVVENMVMLGALSTAAGFPLAPGAIEEAIAGLVPAGTAAINTSAFQAGRSAAEGIN